MVNKLKKFNIKSLFFYIIVSGNVEQIMKEYSIFWDLSTKEVIKKAI